MRRRRRSRRIAGQADDRRSVQQPHGDGTARLDRQAPEYQRSRRFDSRAHAIRFARGDAARGHDEVVPFGRRGEAPRNLDLIVGQNAEIADRTPLSAQQGEQRKTVGIVGLGGRQSLSRRHDLVPGRKYRNAQRASHGQSRLAESRGERDEARIEALAGFDREGALGDVFATASRVGPERETSGQNPRPPSTCTSSCMKTVSAPGGIGAPVKIRAAPRRKTAALGSSPAAIRETTGRAVSPLEARSANATA